MENPFNSLCGPNRATSHFTCKSFGAPHRQGATLENSICRIWKPSRQDSALKALPGIQPEIRLSFGSATRLKTVDDNSPFIRYSPCMGFLTPERGRRQFVVSCKGCRRNVPAGVQEFPFKSIVAKCPLCGEPRQYLPSEVTLGLPDRLVLKRARGVR